MTSKGGNMRIVKAKDYEDMSRKVADIIAAQVTIKPDSVLGLATGSTPIGAYQELIKKYENGRLDFANITSVNLDEYKGLAGDNEQSYYYFMNDNLFNHINIDKSRTFVPDGTVADSSKACQAYEDIIVSVGGVDLQLLGLGGNGHIGFNEPSDIFEKDTHCVNLAPDTIEANQRFFASPADVPRQAYTMGIGAIMSANSIVVAVSGESKAKAVKESFFGEITPQVPASILQLHKDVVIVADEAALSLV